MKLYNDGLPEPIYLAIRNDQYNPGHADYTPSSLISPPYQSQLIREAGDSIMEPASSHIFALQGTSVHYMIEKAGELAGDRWECERRFYGKILGKTIGAQVDILDHEDRSIYDMKVTSVWTSIDGPKEEWVQQLNVQRWCVYKETGINVESLNIVAIYRDWSKLKAHEQGYPSSQAQTIRIPLWTLAETESWIMERIRLHEEARIHGTAGTPPCTEAETWAKPTRYAVMRTGGKRASKLCDTMEEALNVVEEGKGDHIEVRPGERPRCAGYCPVSDICQPYREFLKNKK